MHNASSQCCDKNLVLLNIIYIGYLQMMRIDFSQLDNEGTQRSSASTAFEGTFPQIWKHAFIKEKNPAIQVTQQEQQSLSFSINYPYDVTRSLSPSAINKQLAYLKAKKILPTSTLRFIENTLHAQLERQNENERIKAQSIQVSPQKPLEREKAVEKQSQTFDLKSKLKTISKNQNNSNGKTEKNRKLDHVKARVYDVRPKQARGQRHRKQQNLDGVTLKPILNYTMNSKTAKKVERKRNNHFKTYQTNVFESLYYDAAIYSTKKQMSKMQMEQEQSRVTSRNTSRVKIYSTFEQRLQASIQKNAQRKKKAQNKMEYDLSTGQKYFVPNTARSKVSYFTHFRSLSPHRPDESFKTYHDTQHSKDYKKLNSSHQKTTLNNSYEDTLNHSLDGKYKVVRKPLPRQNRLAELYADLLWSQGQLRQHILSDQERNILLLFLQQIKNHEQQYSTNISKQVFIAFFKEVYANMNLFDRSVLENRLKAQKKIMIHHDSNKVNQRQMQTMRKMAQKEKIGSQNRLSHTHKHFFI